MIQESFKKVKKSKKSNLTSSNDFDEKVAILSSIFVNLKKDTICKILKKNKEDVYLASEFITESLLIIITVIFIFRNDCERRNRNILEEYNF
jgi:hypothetical protein